MKSTEELIAALPYANPFLFVDEINAIDENGCIGFYTLREDSFFYKGHFKDHPVTPGVILTEIMAQIGLVCLGIYLTEDDISNNHKSIGVAMSSTEIEFLKSVLPGEKVKVTSLKQYFRFNKLKCEVRMFNELDILVAKGTISGMIVPISNE